MKKFLHFVGGRASVLLVHLLLFLSLSLHAQVSFTHTSNDDFNIGNFNDLLVGSNAIGLPFQALSMGNWVTTTVIPQTLSGHQAATWNNRFVYLSGGFNGTNNSAQVYRAALQASGISGWTTVSALPKGVRNHAMVIGDNTIYVLGGATDDEVSDRIFYASMSLNGNIGQWQEMEIRLPSSLHGHTAVFCNGYVYVTGGSSQLSNGSGTSEVWVAQVLANGKLSEFEVTTVLPVEVRNHTMVVDGEDVIVIGGVNNDDEKLNTVFRNSSQSDGNLGGWVSETNLPQAVSHHSSFIANGLLVVMGGENSTSITNSVAFADVTTTPLVWSSSTGMVDYVKDFVAFGANGQVVYSGGTNLSGVPIVNARYSLLTLSTNRKSKGLFISTKFDELGAERTISELSFARSIADGAGLEVSYRIAGNDGVWSSWNTYQDISPIEIEETARYLQYKVKFFNDKTAAQATLSSVTMRTPGSQLSGNLSGNVTYTKAASPYWVTENITFTGGTHTFEAGTQLLFLPEVTMEVRQANIVCNGLEGDSVYFTGYLDEEGLWGGIWFSANSNNGVSSQFNYVVISNAGHGTNNANLRCSDTTEPMLNNSVIRNSTGRGIRLQNANINIENTHVINNASHGISLQSSSPTFINTDISNNGDAGVMMTGFDSNPTFTTTTISENKYGIYYNTPNTSIRQPGGSPILVDNEFNGIVLPEGDITNDQTWFTIDYDIILLGQLTVRANRRLTIEPGNTIKALEGASMYFSTSSVNFGELYAVGTEEQPIKFTSFNGEPGGWDGIHLRLNISGQAPSELAYCVVENGRLYNIYAEGSVVNIVNSIIRNSEGDGIRYSNGRGELSHSQVLNNGENGVVISGSNTPVINNTIFSNNEEYPIVVSAWNSIPIIENNSYEGNGLQFISLSGGSFTSDVTYVNDGIPYHVTSDIVLRGDRNNVDLTIEPGVEMHFSPGVSLNVGEENSTRYVGSLLAVGTEDAPIVFTAYKAAEGWSGINFNIGSDLYAASSEMKHCIVEYGTEYNIFCDRTTTPVLENVTIRNAAQSGVYLNAASPVIEQCQILNNGEHGIFVTGASTPSISNSSFVGNGEYPLFLAAWNSLPVLESNSYEDNGMQFISLSGGNFASDGTYVNDGIPYHVTGDIVLRGDRNNVDLTIEPGVEMHFSPGVSLNVGEENSTRYVGSLLAVGTEDAPIVFTAYKAAEGWGGINFNIGSNLYEASSEMKYCIIEHGTEYNIFFDRTTEPTFNNNTVRNSAGYGMRLWNSQPDTLRNNTFANNQASSIYLDGNSNVVLGGKPKYVNNFYGISDFAVYNNTTIDVDARYNFWSAADSAMISNVVYDVFNQSNRGKVNFVEFAQLPWVESDEIVLTGELFYGNSTSTPMSEAVVSIVDFAGGVISQQTVSETGAFAFAPFATGGYRMVVEPAEPWGGVNATDALLVLNHFTRKELLTGLSLAAADVNLSGSVNGTDALFMLKRYAGLIDEFPSGDFLYHYDDYLVDGNSILSVLRVLCFGDVNGSYSLLKSLKTGQGITPSGEVVVTSYNEFELPFDFDIDENAGAISFGFYYPEDMMKVKGVRFDGGNGFVHSAQNGLFRFAWAGTEPIQTNQGQPLRIVVEMEALDFAPTSESVLPELYEHIEIANQWGEPLRANISAPELRTVATSLDKNNIKTSSLVVYPNPVKESATVSFALESDAKVSFELVNAAGTSVYQSDEQSFMPGSHQYSMDASLLANGVYMLNMRVNTNYSESIKVVKIVVSK
ncbi:right-handed parallel beta-helix repeat-containing protein [Natronoflexus pectinivorans]|uniref:Parallel beta-helix repeat protein n=1 Tax=Natronoflexus pectinivorans TaxID=682526 RepID=A0A4R2GLS0_9BACT|nr:right-handed parallel beta-helix repeat-containing protein [Natronoflexus pectinivorans]TCO09680.1 parallel beta-helix repeat protein [Natronoflexus pectinivorans]